MRVDVTGQTSSGGSGSNASVGTTGTTAPTSATEVGYINGSGNLTGVSPSTPLPITGTVTASNPSVGADGSTLPAYATAIGIADGSSNLQTVSSINPLPANILSAIPAGTNNIGSVNIADPNTGAKTAVSSTGSIQATIDPTQIFTDNFEGGSIDMTNRWNTPVVAGSGTVTQSSVSGLVLAVGTTANNAAALSSQPLFASGTGSILGSGMGIKLEATTIATGNYRFWGLGTQGTTYSVTDPIANGIGFEVTTAGVLRAVVYASDVLIFSQNLTIPVDGNQHIYLIESRGNFIQWFLDAVTIPVATVGLIEPDVSILPIRVASLNGASTTTGTPLLSAYVAGEIDFGRNSIQIADGTYAWRKANVSAAGALSTSDINLANTVGSKAPGTAAANSQLNGMVYNSTPPAPTNGQQLALQSDANGNLETIGQDLLFTGQSAQTATINNIIPATASANATNAQGFRSASIQINSTGTAGTYIFEGSNDNVNFITIPVYNQLILTGTPITAAVTASASTIVYTFPIQVQYIRVRIATTITGGSIQAITRLSQAAWVPAVLQTAQATAANLNVTAAVAAAQTLATVTTVGTVTAVTNSTTALPAAQVADVSAVAFTTTTTSAGFTPTAGCSYVFEHVVSAYTSGQCQVTVQESTDGTLWENVYSFPSISSVLSLSSPVLIFKGKQIRYVSSGPTSVLTHTINRTMQSQQAELPYKSLIDIGSGNGGTINPTTTNSVTGTLPVEGLNNYTATINQGTGGSAVTFQLQGTVDNSTWQILGTAIGVTGGATPVSINYQGLQMSYLRVLVVTGVASTTINSITISASIAQGSLKPNAGALTDASGTTSGTANTSTQIMAANYMRKYLLIQNVSSNNIWVNFTAAATTTQPSVELLPGGSIIQESSFVSTEAVNVICSVATQAYTAKWA